MSRDEINEVLLQAHFGRSSSNRIDEIVIFHPLREDLAEIVDIQLRRVKELLRAASSWRSRPSARVPGRTGYDPDYGARPLKRAIQRELQDPLALAILSGEFNEGDTIRVERVPDGLDFMAVYLSIIRNGVKWGARVGRLDVFCYHRSVGTFVPGSTWHAREGDGAGASGRFPRRRGNPGRKP